MWVRDAARSRSAVKVQVRIEVQTEVGVSFMGLCVFLFVSFFHGRYTSSIPQPWRWLMAEKSCGWLWR